MNKSKFLLVFISSSFSLALQASEVDIPHSFSAGTAAIASEVNENFDELEAAVDDNHQKIVALQDRVEALELENKDLLTQIEALQNAQPTAVATPVFPRGSGPSFGDYSLNDGRGVFTVRFNVAVNPDTFVADSNVTVSGAGATGTGSISWTDNFSTLIYTTLEDFTTISPCFSGGLNFTIKGTGETAAQDTHGKPIDGDRNGAPGGDFSITYDIVC